MPCRLIAPCLPSSAPQAPSGDEWLHEIKHDGFLPLTVTFSLGSIRPDFVLREYERFYARLCRLLISNYERPSKHHLLPFAIAFRDDPSTRVVHPGLADRFLEVVPSLEATWRRIPLRTVDPTSAHDAPTYANRTLHADVPFALTVRELMRADPVGSRSLVRARIRKVVAYAAKLGRRRDTDDGVDLFTVLPTTPPRSSPRKDPDDEGRRDHRHVRDAFSFAFDRPRVASGRRGDGYKFVA